MENKVKRVYLRGTAATPTPPRLKNTARTHRWCHTETNSINEQVKLLRGSSTRRHCDQLSSAAGQKRNDMTISRLTEEQKEEWGGFKNKSNGGDNETAQKRFEEMEG